MNGNWSGGSPQPLPKHESISKMFMHWSEFFFLSIRKNSETVACFMSVMIELTFGIWWTEWVCWSDGIDWQLLSYYSILWTLKRLFFTLQQERENFNCYISLLANCQRAWRLNVDIIIFERLHQNGTGITFVLFCRFNLDLNENNLHNKWNWVFGAWTGNFVFWIENGWYSVLVVKDSINCLKIGLNYHLMMFHEANFSRITFFQEKCLTNDRKTTNYNCLDAEKNFSKKEKKKNGIDLKVFDMNSIQ